VSPEYRPTRQGRKVLAILRGCRAALRAVEIAERLGADASPEGVGATCGTLVRHGLIGRERYRGHVYFTYRVTP